LLSWEPSDEKKIEACDALARIGPPAIGAVDALIASLKEDRPLRDHAGSALVAIGPEAIPALRAAMAADPNRMMLVAASTWARIDINAGVSYNTFADRIAHGTLHEQMEGNIAGLYLWQRGDERASLTNVQRFRPIAPPAIPRVEPARANVAEKISPEPGEESLDTAAKSDKLLDREIDQINAVLEAHTRFALSYPIRAIARLGPDAAVAVPDLQKLLSDRDNDLRIEVAVALGEIGPGAKAAIPALILMSDNHRSDVRRAAAQALVKIVPDGKPLGPALLAAIYHADGESTKHLATAFRRSGDVGALRGRISKIASDDPDPDVRVTARNAVDLLTPRPRIPSQ